MRGPAITVVLPTYNRAEMLPAALVSVCAQTYTDWELIVVDDGSSDETPTVISEFAARDSRIRSLRNEPNIRLPKSLNRGFAEARGRLLTWTSDDNLYHPHALATLAASFDANPDAGLAYASMRMIDEDGLHVADWEAR